MVIWWYRVKSNNSPYLLVIIGSLSWNAPDLPLARPSSSLLAPCHSSTTKHTPASRPLHMLSSFHPMSAWFTCSFLPDLYSKPPFQEGVHRLLTWVSLPPPSLAQLFIYPYCYLTTHLFCFFILLITYLLHIHKSLTAQGVLSIHSLLFFST